MWMDWHSSGITTSRHSLKRGLAPMQNELGIYVCGGRGKHLRKTPEELQMLWNCIGIDGQGLTRASRLVAKVDGAGRLRSLSARFLCHGRQQMDRGAARQNEDKRQARRYHWHSAAVLEAPHSAIDGHQQGEMINLTDHRAAKARAAQLTLLADLGPDGIIKQFEELSRATSPQAELPYLIMPTHHDVRKDVFGRRLHGTLAAASEQGPVDFQNCC